MAGKKEEEKEVGAAEEMSNIGATGGRRGRQPKAMRLSGELMKSYGSLPDIWKRRREEEEEVGAELGSPFKKSNVTDRSPVKKKEESNGEPSDMDKISQMLKQMMTKMDEEKEMATRQREGIKKEIIEMREEQVAVREMMKRELRQVREEMERKEVSLKKELQETKEKLKSLEEKWNEREEERRNEKSDNEEMKRRIRENEKTIEDKIRLDRKKNIIVKGLTADREQAELEGEVKRVLEGLAGKEVEVEEICNLGSENSKIQLVKMKSWNDKKLVMKNKSKLGNSKIYIEDDLTIKERNIQAEIYKVMKRERENNKRANAGYKRLWIEGKEFRWSEEKNELEEKQIFRPRRREIEQQNE